MNRRGLFRGHRPLVLWVVMLVHLLHFRNDDVGVAFAQLHLGSWRWRTAAGRKGDNCARAIAKWNYLYRRTGKTIIVGKFSSNFDELSSIVRPIYVERRKWNIEVIFSRAGRDNHFYFSPTIVHSVLLGCGDAIEYRPLNNYRYWPGHDMTDVVYRELDMGNRRMNRGYANNKVSPLGYVKSIYLGLSRTGSSSGSNLGLFSLNAGLCSDNLRLVSLIFHSVDKLFGTICLIFCLHSQLMRIASLGHCLLSESMRINTATVHFVQLIE